MRNKNTVIILFWLVNCNLLDGKVQQPGGLRGKIYEMIDKEFNVQVLYFDSIIKS